MDYEQKYNKLINAIKVLQETNPSDIGIRNWVNDNVPELRESEDEKIRKQLLNWFKGTAERIGDDRECFSGITYKSVIAWLEKIIIPSHNDIDSSFIEDIKNMIAEAPLLMQSDKKKMIAWLEKQDGQKPVIEMKTPEESLGIDSETYNKIVDECIYGEQKPTWSEEDEKAINDIMWIIEAYRKNGFNETHIQMANSSENWLKSLIKRIQPQPKREWSEEEKARIDKIVDVLDWAEEKGYICYSDWEDYVCYVKSLRPQNTWKPSDEQMQLLKELVEDNNQRYFHTLLRSLYEQLEKLKGE